MEETSRRQRRMKASSEGGLDPEGAKFYSFFTVHLRIILVSDQLDAQFLLQYVYLNPLHVSSNSVLIFRRTTVLIQLLV